jgi:hypothetical protein
LCLSLASAVVRLAAAFGAGIATAHRCVTEVIALLADLAPDLREAMRIAQRRRRACPGPAPPVILISLG